MRFPPALPTVFLPCTFYKNSALSRLGKRAEIIKSNYFTICFFASGKTIKRIDGKVYANLSADATMQSNTVCKNFDDVVSKTRKSFTSSSLSSDI